jgi:hypothetical protein
VPAISVYTTYFKTDRPSRTTTMGVVKLAAPEAHIEITVTARPLATGD